MFPNFEQCGCSFLTAGALLDGLAAWCGLSWMELSLAHSVTSAGIFPAAWCGLSWIEVLVMLEAFAQAYDLTVPVFKSLRSSTAPVSASAVESDGNVFRELWLGKEACPHCCDWACLQLSAIQQRQLH